MSLDEEYTAYVRGRLTWLRQIAYPLCQDWHRADDLVQTAITRLYVKWRQARLADNLDAYVRVILIDAKQVRALHPEADAEQLRRLIAQQKRVNALPKISFGIARTEVHRITAVTTDGREILGGVARGVGAGARGLGGETSLRRHHGNAGRHRREREDPPADPRRLTLDLRPTSCSCTPPYGHGVNAPPPVL
ncbi:SigE family RNA polymerase sigma factor [Nonomuraea glycinis]|uniref:hypothetical protein n=1 Tax=Nonomuraea glycinis TaxID=2047744 RepID=UPI002E12659C|nr:hypothetical protein OHA68_23165 [Nonomuraea glycinis]